MELGVLLELALESMKADELSHITAGTVLLAAVAKQSQTKEKTVIVRAKALPVLLRVLGLHGCWAPCYACRALKELADDKSLKDTVAHCGVFPPLFGVPAEPGPPP